MYCEPSHQEERMIGAVEFIQQLKVPAGRAVAMLREVRDAAQAAGDAEVVGRCDRALSAYMRQHQTEQSWTKQQQSGVARDEADAMNRELDEALAITHSVCEGHARHTGKTPRAEAARLLLSTLFPNGLAAIVRASYEVQHTAMIVIARAYKTKEIQSAAALLGVDEQLQLVADQNDAFGVAIRRAGRALTFRDVQTDRDQSHAELCELIAAILFRTYGDDPDAITLRARLLTPITTQTDLVRKQRAAGRQTDLDPDSGAEQPISPIADPS